MALVIRAMALLAAVGTAQAVQLRPRLVAGDTFRLEVTRVHEEAGRSDANYTIWTPVDVRVISARNNGFEIDWRPAASVIERQAAADPGVIAGSQALHNISFRVALTADGEFQRLLNEPEVRGQLTAAVGATLRATVPEADRREQFREVLTPGFMVALATRDAEIYFGVNGLSLAVGESLETSLDQPSPWGGTVPAVYRIRLASATAETAAVTTTTTYDADALLKLTLGILEKGGAKIPPGGLEKARLEMTDDGTYEVDRRLGIVRDMTINRRVSLPGVQRLDRWTIKLVKAPARVSKV